MNILIYKVYLRNYEGGKNRNLLCVCVTCAAKRLKNIRILLFSSNSHPVVWGKKKKNTQKVVLSTLLPWLLPPFDGGITTLTIHLI